MLTHRLSAAVAAATFIAAVPLAAQRTGGDQSSWSWKGSIPAGATFGIFNSRGEIRVRPATGNEIEVRAEKSSRWTRGNVREVEFEVKKTAGGGITICALTADADCESSGINHDHHDRWGSDREPTVDFTVYLPKGLKLVAGSGNGDVDVMDVGGDVRAASGNGSVSVSKVQGSVRASSGNGGVSVEDANGPVEARSGNGRISVTTSRGPVEASSGNGSIDVRMNELSGAGDMTFSTGNGSISITVPSNFEAEVDASQPRGAIRSDFPITIESGRFGSGRIHGTIGKGGRRVRMSTGNGTIEIRKG